MNPKSNNIQNTSKIARYISGNATKLEKIWFGWIVARNPETKKLAEKMKNDWNTVGSYMNGKNVNPNKAWSSLYQRLEKENLLPSSTKNATQFAPRTYLKYAAIALITLTLTGIGGYMHYNPKLILLSNNSNQNTLITTLPDGTTIYLAQNSVITYPKKFIGNSRKVKLIGEAFFEVTKNPNKPFIISTEAASVKVLGTSFNLKSNGSANFELNVVEGKVGINLNGSPSENVIAVAGDRVMAKDKKLVKRNAITLRTAKNTMVRLQFQDERFDNIINILNKTYGTNIKLAGNKLKDRHISVTFENDISSIVNILSVSFNLSVDEQPNNTIIFTEKHE